MVSKRTGMPRGRPQKHALPLEKRSRGRPPKPLATDPDRYALALFEAHIRVAADAGMSELRMAETLTGLAYGLIVPTRENIDRLLRGEPFLVEMQPWRLPPWRLKQGPSERSESWRLGNAFRPYADDLRRKLLRLRNGEDAQWLGTMASIWDICLRQQVDRIEDARRLAASIEYFEKELLPRYLVQNPN
jgi:hypothetical protein